MRRLVAVTLMTVTLMAVTHVAGGELAHAEDPPITTTVTINQGQTRTFTVNAPSDRVQCETDYQEDKGSYCLQTKHHPGGAHDNIAADIAPRYGRCNGPFSLAPTTGTDGSTITYAHTDGDGWIGWGGYQSRNDYIEVRGRQMRMVGVGDPNTNYLTVALFGTQTVTLTDKDQGTGVITRSTYTAECSLAVRVRIYARGPNGETSLQNAGVNAAFTKARTNVRELTTTGRTEGDYVPPNTNRCRVVRYDGGLNRASSGEMSWCGTYRGENNEEVAPNGEALSTLCGRSNVTCHTR